MSVCETVDIEAPTPDESELVVSNVTASSAGVGRANVTVALSNEIQSGDGELETGDVIVTVGGDEVYRDSIGVGAGGSTEIDLELEDLPAGQQTICAEVV